MNGAPGRLCGAAAAILLAAGCAAPGESPEGREVPTYPAMQEIRVGSVDDEAQIMTWFRQMTVGADGRMYTIHPTEQVMVMWAPDGTRLKAIGGRGDGPSEFQNIFRAGWVADTLWVLDLNGHRFKQFNADGDLLGTFSVPFVMGEDPMVRQPPRVDDMLSDGTLVGSPPAFSNQIAAGVITHHVPMIMNRDGEVLDSLVPIPFGNNMWAISDPEEPMRGGMYMTQPYADGPVWAYVPGERAMLILDREAPAEARGSYRLTKVDFNRDTLFSRTYPFDATPVPTTEADSILDATAERISGTRFMGGLPLGTARAWAANGMYRPSHYPAITHMVLAGSGEIWLRERPVGEDAAWLVLDRNGEPRWRTTLPAGMTVLVADGDQAWGTERDELDVPYLVRFRVRRDGEG